MARLGAILATAIAIGVGLLTVWGLLAGSGSIVDITHILLQLTVITVAVTILLGILNLFSVHLRRILAALARLGLQPGADRQRGGSADFVGDWRAGHQPDAAGNRRSVG